MQECPLRQHAQTPRAPAATSAQKPAQTAAKTGVKTAANTAAKTLRTPAPAPTRLTQLDALARRSTATSPLAALQARADLTTPHRPNHTRQISGRANQTGLPDALKSAVEQLSGQSLDDVRVRHGSPLAGQMQARAFARGRDIHIGPGQGQHLAHETWHVVQQKQGRVRPNGWLLHPQSGTRTPVNDSPQLEAEADRMAAAATRLSRRDTPLQRRPLASVLLGSAAHVLQPVWYLHKGLRIWVKAGQDPPPGAVQEHFVLHRQTPHMINPGSLGSSSYDSSAASTVTTAKLAAKDKAPGRNTLKSKAKAVGADLYARSAKRPLKQLQQDAKFAASLASLLEQIAASALPKNHETRVKAAFDKPGFKPADYRKIIRGQDEISRTSTTGNIFIAFKAAAARDASLGASEKAATLALGRQLMRLASALRTPTHGVVAPMLIGGKVQGQQHPKEKSIPNLAGGRSGHGLNDPLRADAGLSTYAAFRDDADVSPVILYLTQLLGHLVGTLNHMMWPLGAANVADWLPAFVQQQRQEREKVKAMTNLVARILGVPVVTAPQPARARMRARSTPASPMRHSPAAERKRFKRSARVLQSAAQSAAKKAKPAAALGKLKQQATTLQSVTTPTLADQATLQQANADLLALLATLSPATTAWDGSWRGRVTDSGALANDATGATGWRDPSIQQFRTECGQMAAHNALVMTPATGHADTDAALHSLGPLQDDINEDTIRNMLVQAGHPQIPVVGNLGEMHILINHLQAGDAQVLTNFGQGPAHLAGLAGLRDFRAGTTHALRLVVNTTGHLGPTDAGYHWIAVELTRVTPPMGAPQIHITYRDSLPQDTDYSHFFAALRHALG